MVYLSVLALRRIGEMSRVYTAVFKITGRKSKIGTRNSDSQDERQSRMGKKRSTTLYFLFSSMWLSISVYHYHKKTKLKLVMDTIYLLQFPKSAIVLFGTLSHCYDLLASLHRASFWLMNCLCFSCYWHVLKKAFFPHYVVLIGGSGSDVIDFWLICEKRLQEVNSNQRTFFQFLWPELFVSLFWDKTRV